MKKIGYIGLGKMGINMVQSFGEHGISVVAYNRGEGPRAEARKKGIEVVNSLADLVSKLRAPRVIWLMVSNSGVDAVLDELLPLLSRGDTLIDGGNTYFEDTKKRATRLKKAGIRFLDAGTSGGPSGARHGACIMIGGDKKTFSACEYIFRAVAAPGAYLHVGDSGAGHFVKMVHNGIEYGMMQALAEGFSTLKKSSYKVPLRKVANLYNNRSVIESRLVGWLEKAYKEYGEELKSISGSVAHTGEGEWTVKTAKKLGVKVNVIAESFKIRVRSRRKPSYAGKILSALRNQFGGHNISGASNH